MIYIVIYLLPGIVLVVSIIVYSLFEFLCLLTSALATLSLR